MYNVPILGTEEVTVNRRDQSPCSHWAYTLMAREFKRGEEGASFTSYRKFFLGFFPADAPCVWRTHLSFPIAAFFGP